MELLEIAEVEHLRRGEAAERLRALADALSRHDDVEFERAGVRFRLKVPDDIRLKVELDIESGGTELEIELTW